MKRLTLAVLVVMVTTIATSFVMLAQDSTSPSGEADVESGYAPVNGLDMYYEIRGSGQPLIVLHGGYMNIDMLNDFVSPLAETRQVIAVELQGHGRTNDIPDRPLTYEQMADDVAGLIDYLELDQVDVFGYSMGGGTAMQLVIRHPERVRKLIVASMTYNSEGWHPDLHAFIETVTPETFIGTPLETEYNRLAPNPENFPTLVNKLVELDTMVQDWSAETIAAITAPTLIMLGDSDAVRPEHAVEMFKLLGGGVNGDFTGLPNAQLAIIPGATHTSYLYNVDLLVPMITGFLDAPLAETQ